MLFREKGKKRNDEDTLDVFKNLRVVEHIQGYGLNTSQGIYRPV